MAFLLEDVRYAFRTLAKNPAFTLVAVTALSLGIGVNATVFTLANGVLFKSQPFDRSDRVLYLTMRNANRAGRMSPVSLPDFQDWRDSQKSFEFLSAYRSDGVNYSDKTGLPELYSAARVMANAFPSLGQKPALGREFSPADEHAGGAPVAILSYGLWERRYGKDPSVLGRSVRMNDVATTIVGIMPQGFMFPGTTDIWLPLIPGADSEKRERRAYTVFGRLKDGASEKSARAEIIGISKRLEAAYPVTNQGFTAQVMTFGEFFNGPQINLVFTAMLGAVGFVLLIACANVANLLLGRAVGRTREISIRAALGASRWRVIRQLLVESVMLSLGGGVLGWLISIWGVRAFDAVVVPLGKPPYIDFSMDYRVFAYLIAVSIGTGVLFGLVPALRLSKLDVNTALKDGGRGSSGAGRAKYLSGLLVVAEMALAVVLLVGAGLMIHSFLAAYKTSIGTDVANILTMRLNLPEAKYAKNPDLIAFHDRLHKAIESLPGVEKAAIAETLPTGGSENLPFELEGAPPTDEKRRQTLSAIVIGYDYFGTAGLRPLRGRVFDENDGVTGPPAILANQEFADKYWPNQDPIGKRLRWFNGKSPETWAMVVGIVPNILQNSNSSQRDALIYIPYRFKPERDMAVMIRTRVPPSTLATAVRQTVQSINEDLPIYRLLSMEDRLAQNYWPWRVFGTLFAIFAAIALLLASVGLYAVIAHSVSQRTQEIGVRMALGASSNEIYRLVFSSGMLQIGIGLALGLAGAFGVTRILKSILATTVSPTDPVTFLLAAGLLAAAGGFGCLIPARRAMAVDPVVALRHE